MGFSPLNEPCSTCGREVDECVCGFAPDIPLDEPLLEEDDQWDSWDDNGEQELGFVPPTERD